MTTYCTVINFDQESRVQSSSLRKKSFWEEFKLLIKTSPLPSVDQKTKGTIRRIHPWKKAKNLPGFIPQIELLNSFLSCPQNLRQRLDKLLKMLPFMSCHHSHSQTTSGNRGRTHCRHPNPGSSESIAHTNNPRRIIDL